MENTTERIIDVIKAVLLITLILIRLLIDSDKNTWVDLINYIGLLTAYVSFYTDIHKECAQHRKFNLITGLFVIILIPLIITAALIWTEIIALTSMWNDVISLLTLVITLPARLYIHLLKSTISE